MIEIVKNKKSPFEGKAEEVRNAIEPGMANDNVSTVICRFTKIKKPFSKWWIITLFVLLLGIAAFIFKDQILTFWNDMTKTISR